MQLKFFLFSTLAIGFTACTPKIDAEELSLGEIDPTHFITVGGSTTAGYSDDALHEQGQGNSFSTILYRQLNKVQEITYTYPGVGQSSVGINTNGDSKLILGYKTDCNGETSLSPVRLATIGDVTALSTNVYTNGSFNNVGIPNMSIIDVNTPGYANPYYTRIASSPGTSSVMQDAQSIIPTLYTVQLGEDDLLSYALSGGTGTLPPPVNGAAGVGFDGSLDELIQALGANNAKGAIANIPDVTNFPYFTTIPYNGLTLDAANAASLNSVFNPLGLTFQVGENAFTMDDPNEPFGVRKMVEGERILLSVPLDSIKCYGMGSIIPIPDKYVLSQDEISEITSRMTGYNSIILTAAQQNNLAHVDVKSLYASLNSGIVYNGVSMDFGFVTGGFFSLDGRNLNPIGHALLANKFIESINEKYGSLIPLADVTKYTGVIFP